MALEDTPHDKASYLSAQEAAAELGISLPTLYAYVSRGLVRSELAGGPRRCRRYHAEDVRKLKARKEQRRDPEKAVETALHWGVPVLDSTLTLIAGGHLYYRGHEATRLAATHTVEQVAALLWTGEEDASRRLFGAAPERLSPCCRKVLAQLRGLAPVEAFQALLPIAAAQDLAAYDLRPDAVARTGARILRLLATISAGGQAVPGEIARTLQRAWVPDYARAADLIRAALILCADHELNVSSFTARCVASAGATPYAVVIAGLSALQGGKHGGQGARVDALFREAGNEADVPAALVDRLKRGETIPGFGHPLYPQGDPRARMLLGQIRAAYPEAPALPLVAALEEAAFRLIGEYPNVDFGLVTLARVLTLPPGAAMALFAIGRTLGWIGHAIEQYGQDQLIRPRARYVGAPPAASE